MTKIIRTSLFVIIAMSFALAACGTAAPSTPAEPVTVIQTQLVEVTAQPQATEPPLPAGSIQRRCHEKARCCASVWNFSAQDRE